MIRRSTGLTRRSRNREADKVSKVVTFSASYVEGGE